MLLSCQPASSELALTSLDCVGFTSFIQTTSSRTLSMRLKCQSAVSFLIRICLPLSAAFIDAGGLLSRSEQLYDDMITGELLPKLLSSVNLRLITAFLVVASN